MKADNNIWKKSVISSFIFVFFVVIIFYFIFKENSWKMIITIFKETNKFYIVLAILAMACFSICEASNLKVALKSFGEKITFRNAYKYALAGFFVSSITPSSTGGDPMQLYLMKRDGISISHAAITLLSKLLAFQFTSLTISLLCFLTSFHFFSSSLGSLRFIIYLGMSLNVLVFILYFLMIFYKPVILFLVKLFSKLLQKIHYKKCDVIIEHIYVQVEEYSMAAICLKKNKIVFTKIVLTTMVQMLLYYSIPYFVYRSLGLSDNTIFEFIRIQSVLFVSVSSLPFPGAIGVSEATFMHLYKSLFPTQILGSAMVITRFINFYIFVIYSALVTYSLLLKDNFQKKK